MKKINFLLLYFLLAQISTLLYTQEQNLSNYQNSCEEAFLKGDFNKSIEFAKMGLQINPKSVVLTNYLVQNYFYLKQYNEMQNVLQEWLNYGIKTNNNNILTLAYNGLGNLFQKKNIDYQAYFYYNKAINLAEKDKNLLNLGSSYHNMGNYYLSKKDEKQAEKFLLKAINIKDKINDILGLAISYNQLAELYKKEEDFTKSLKYYEISLNYAKKIQNSFFIDIIYNNMSYLFFSRKNFKEALNTLNILLKIQEEDRYAYDYNKKSNTYLSIAIIHIYNLDYLEAMKNVKHSLLLKIENAKEEKKDLTQFFQFERNLLDILNEMQFKQD